MSHKIANFIWVGQIDLGEERFVATNQKVAQAIEIPVEQARWSDVHVDETPWPVKPVKMVGWLQIKVLFVPCRFTFGAKIILPSKISRHSQISTAGLLPSSWLRYTLTGRTRIIAVGRYGGVLSDDSVTARRQQAEVLAHMGKCPGKEDVPQMSKYSSI